MSPRVIDSKIHNYELRRNAYHLFHGRDDQDAEERGETGGNGLYVINTLFNTITSIRNPKISFFFRDVVKMATDELMKVHYSIRTTLAGFKDANDLTAPQVDEDVMVIPSWALRAGDPE